MHFRLILFIQFASFKRFVEHPSSITHSSDKQRRIWHFSERLDCWLHRYHVKSKRGINTIKMHFAIQLRSQHRIFQENIGSEFSPGGSSERQQVSIKSRRALAKNANKNVSLTRAQMSIICKMVDMALCQCHVW